MKNPYKELSPYLEEDAHSFKGRTSEIEEMYESFDRNEYLVCHADSGEGKSSIIEAGLIPKMKTNCYFPVPVRFKTDEHFKKNNIDFDNVVCGIIENEIEKLRSNNRISVNVVYPKRLTNSDDFELTNWEKKLINSFSWMKLRYVRITIDNLLYTPVLIFDQFEEVFTNPLSQEWTDKFFKWLQELSTDLCPQRIINELEKYIDNDDFPEINTQKYFKAIFSLRSEYVGKLDYWGMQRHYIPLLKNNRYLLRPLTIKGAKEVITQQDGYDGLNAVADEIIDVLRRQQKGKNYVLTEKSELPCIPALFLSIICSRTFSMSQEDRTAFMQRFVAEKNEDKETAINSLIEDFYEKTVADSGIPSMDIGIIEDILVNNEGIRQRVSSHADALKAIDFSTRYLEKLKDTRLIRVIPEYNREDDSIELIHDALCPIVHKRKELRLLAETKKREELEKAKLEKAEKDAKDARESERKIRKQEEQRKNLTSSFFLLILFVFVVCLLYICYCDRDTFVNLFNLNGDDVVSRKCEDIWGRLLFANFAVFAILIHSAVKRLRISRWLSIYGLITNVVLLFPFLVGFQKEKIIPLVVGLVALGVPLVTLIYSLKYYQSGPSIKSDIKILKKSIPLVVFFLGMSLFVFYLCIFNNAIEDPKPSDSSWGIVAISFLAHELTRLLTGQKEKRNLLCLFILLLSILALNTFYDGLKFPSYIIVSCLVCVIIVLIWMYSDIAIGKRFWTLFSVASVIIATVILNMGFNITSVRYNSVKHVNNWITVTVKDANHIGIVSACDGDTLLPCVFDSVDDTSHYACMTSNKIHYDREISVKEYKGLFTFDKAKNEALYKCLTIPKLEKRINEIAHNRISFDDTLKYYAAKTHFELRNANILFLKTGNIYSLSSVPSLDSLFKCQMSSLSNILSYMNNYKMISGSIDGDCVMNVTKSLARTLYLCQVKDRIMKKDSVNLFTLCQDVMLLYFDDEYDEHYKRYFNQTIENNYKFIIGDFYKSYHTKVESSQMTSEAKSIEQWYNLAEMYTIQDLNWNASLYTKGIVNELKKMLERQNNGNNQKLSNLDSQYAKFNELLGKKNRSINDIIQAIGLYMNNREKWEKEEVLLNEYHNKTLAEDLRKMEVEKAQMEKNYQDLISSVFNTFYAVVKEDPGNIYNSVFINLCAHLYAVAGFRLYETSAYQKMLEEMENVKVSSYQGFKTMMDNINKIKNDAVDSLENSLIRRK